MAKNKVFIGYDYACDKAAKDRLLGWDVDEEFDFSSYDRSLDVAVDSEQAAVFKKDLAGRIGASSHFLCIVGTETFHSAWMAWQIRKAIALNKKLVAAKTDSTNSSPPALQGVGASWIPLFNFDAIKKALNGPELVETMTLSGADAA